ncbi:MAG: NAD(P)H-dependent oxidoreductase, partial [Gammaproteobacteria bacterium]|nr:NAD(P)H-dependent oxidoreductase [Gammaproteobacteria bacterium]
ISQELSDSDAFVIVSPEWHGQVPAGLKNFFLLWGKGELAHKPALIVTVSSGDGGSYPVAELRMSSYKNNRICYIPEQVIVRNVEKVLNDDPAMNNEAADTYFRDRIRYALTLLKEYAAALHQVRASGAGDRSVYKNGM